MQLKSPRIEGLSSPARGILWIVVSCFWASIMVVLVRYLSATVHSQEIVFLRNILALMFMLPWLYRSGGLSVLKTDKMRFYFMRGCIGLIAMSSWFYAIEVVPLPQAISLSFALPLFATLGAVFILKERCGIHRTSALIVGFLGILLIMRPDVGGMNYTAGIALASTFFMAMSTLIVKHLSRSEPPERIVFYMTFVLTPLSFVPALLVWEWPTASEWGWFIVLGYVSNLMQVSMSRAYSMAEVTLLMPFDFLRLVFVSVLSYFLFNEVLDAPTVAGACVILASSVYTAHREAVLKKQKSYAAPEAH